MNLIRAPLLVASLILAPTAVTAAGAYMPKPAHLIAPCGWSSGSLPDPAETQRCLAQRYQPPKARTVNPSPAAAPPQAERSDRP
jgi:hypothetical protein